MKNTSSIFFYKLMIALLCVLLIVALVGCNNKSGADNQGNESTEYEQDDSSKQYSFVIPQSLFFGKTGEVLVDEISDSTATFLLKTGEEVPVSQMISSAQLNEDGTVTMYFTENQLEQYKIFLRDCAALYTYIDSYPETSIKSTEFPNNDLTEIIVYVDSNIYESTSTDGIFANAYTATNMGMYQVLNGVNTDEWSAHVTVKDYKTGDIVTEDYYPND